MGDNASAPPSATVHLAGTENAHLYFSGPPQGLTGTIPLVNTGADKQKVRSIAVSSEKLLGAARLPLREMPFYARLYGGEQASVPATLVLDAPTPPGAYGLELSVGERTMAATAHVSEVVDLRLDPSQITIPTRRLHTSHAFHSSMGAGAVVAGLPIMPETLAWLASRTSS